MGRESESGLPVEPVYGPGEPPGFDPVTQLGQPGEFPFTRGIYPGMYTSRPWTMRQYAGFATARESNQRYHQLIAAGTTGLSVAFDLPTQMGYDSDASVAHGEVGKVGVVIDSIEDMRALLDGIPLDRVSTSMTINAPAAVLLLLYQLVAEEQGVAASALTGTIQNDVLKEYIARGTYIYPQASAVAAAGRRHLRLLPPRMPRWNTISISGYHMAEAGATPVQEIAFTLANAGVRPGGAARRAGGRRLRAAPLVLLRGRDHRARGGRQVPWARIMRDEFGAADPRSQMLRFHTQTAGVQLTAQQPGSTWRGDHQALAAVLGGTQSLHTNSYDEAIALPTERAARLALRTQQVLANETDLTATADPFAGSYAMESMTDDVETAAAELMAVIENQGGAVAAIERGFQKGEIERSAYQVARQIDTGSGSWWASTSSSPTVTSGTSRCRSIPASKNSKQNGWRSFAPAVTLTNGAAGWRSSSGQRRARRTCSCRSGKPSGRAPRSARRVMRYETSGAPTARPRSPDDPSGLPRSRSVS